MKYLPCCLAILLGCTAVGIGVWITKDATWLMGLYPICFASYMLYPE